MEAGLKQLGIEIAINATGVAAGKVIINVAGKAFSVSNNAKVGWSFVRDKVPGASFLVEKLDRSGKILTALDHHLTQITGDPFGKAAMAIGYVSASIAPKLSLAGGNIFTKARSKTFTLPPLNY